MTVDDPARLAAAYDTCRRLHATHGRSYYLATLLLPPAKRPAISALYAFARLADDMVDTGGPAPATAAQRLDRLAGALQAGEGADARLDAVADAVVRATRDTVARWSIPASTFDDFFASMRMDLSVTEYATWDDLLGYMHGSAAVIGVQTLPVLEPLPGHEPVATAYARDLGLAFQLTNFIRDVGEDLDRGRVYLPLADLDRFGLDRADLEAHAGRADVDARVRGLLAFEIERARALYRAAAPGVRLLHPTSRDCIRTAIRLYAGILGAVERADYRVLDRRVAVPVLRRAAVALPGAVRAWRSRRPHHTHQASVCSTSENPNPRSSTGA